MAVRGRPARAGRDRRQRLTACLLHNEPASYSQWRGEAQASRSESESEQGDESLGVDAKRGDLPLARVKYG